MDLIEQFQDDLVQRMGADPFFATITIISAETGVTESDVKETLGTRIQKGGKTGAAVIVMQPTRVVRDDNVPGPQYDFATQIRVLENPRINRKPGGTLLSASTISLYIEQLFHIWVSGNNAVRYERTDPYNDGEGIVGFDVTLGWFAGQAMPLRVAIPTLATAGDDLTLACAMPGAAIFYTLDGNYPAPSTTLYSAPFAPPAGSFRLRACAYAAAHQASGILEATITQTTSP